MEMVGLFLVGSLLGGVYEKMVTGVTGSSVALEQLGVSPAKYGIPFLPIYGFGLLVVYAISVIMPTPQYSIITQIIVMIIVLDVLECVGGHLATKINGTDRWKYNGYTICNGYVSIKATVVWLVLGTSLLLFFNRK